MVKTVQDAYAPVSAVLLTGMLARVAWARLRHPPSIKAGMDGCMTRRLRVHECHGRDDRQHNSQPPSALLTRLLSRAVGLAGAALL